MILLDQVKDDLEALDENECLLKAPTNNRFRLVTQVMNEDGVYGYWDANNGRWLKDGMVAGRHFWPRKIEHVEGSKLKGKHVDSLFYRRYPDRSVADQVKDQRLGLHRCLCCLGLQWVLQAAS